MSQCKWMLSTEISIEVIDQIDREICTETPKFRQNKIRRKTPWETYNIIYYCIVLLLYLL